MKQQTITRANISFGGKGHFKINCMENQTLNLPSHMLMLPLCIQHIVSLLGDHELRRATAKQYRGNGVERLSLQVPRH